LLSVQPLAIQAWRRGALQIVATSSVEHTFGVRRSITREFQCKPDQRSLHLREAIAIEPTNMHLRPAFGQLPLALPLPRAFFLFWRAGGKAARATHAQLKFG
jgi:hypothetical protein